MPLTLNGTTGIAGANGSASTPAVQGEDTNTGVFFPAADTIAFAEGGVEVARFDASGRLGIGTSSPTANLHLSSAGTNATLKLSNSTSGSGSSDGYDLIMDGNDAYVWNRENGPLLFGTNGAERARIDSSGNLLVGTTSNTSFAVSDGILLTPAGRLLATQANECPINASRRGTDGSICQFFKNATLVGTITVGASSTAYNTSSDYRLKENVQPMQDALAKIAQLNPVTYTWKADGSDGQGFIAHELQAVVPDCVTGEKDAVDAEGKPQYQGVDTSFLVATLVKAVQELTARIAALEAAQ
jgi:hypothetical protein